MVSPTVEVSESALFHPVAKRGTSRRRGGGRRRSRICSGCGQPRDRAYQAYCRACHAAYERATRPKHSELPDERRRKLNCRRYTNQLIARGKIKRTPCACGSTDVEARQLGDYSSPYDVDFVCKACRTGVRHVVAA